MKVKLTKSELAIFAAAILQKYPSLTNQAFKKKLGITLGRDFFAKYVKENKATTAANSPTPEFFDKVSKLDSLYAVAKFCKDELGNNAAYVKLFGTVSQTYINTVAANDRNGCTPFHGSIINNDRDHFDKYLPFADVNKPNGFRDTPLILACSYNTQRDYSHIINKLLNHPDVNINAQGQSGYTALHMAVQNENYPLIEQLVKKGIDPYITCNQGRTALELGILKSLDNPAILPLLRKMHDKLNLRIQNHGFVPQERPSLLFDLIMQKQFAVARLAIEFGANVNQECTLPGIRGEKIGKACYFSLYFVHQLAQGKAFTEEDIPALEFFRDTDYDFNRHKNPYICKGESFGRSVLCILCVGNRTDELIFISNYLAKKLGMLENTSYIKIRELSDGQLMVYMGNDYYPLDELNRRMSEAYDELEASYAILQAKLVEVHPEAIIADSSIVGMHENPEVKNQIKLQKISAIQEKIDDVIAALEGTNKHIPNWIRRFTANIDHHELGTLDQFLERISNWSLSTLNKIAFEKDISPDLIVKQNVVRLPAVSTEPAALYENQYTLAALSSIEILGTDTIRLLPPKNLDLIKDITTLNQEDTRKVEALVRNPRLASQKGMPGVKLLKGNNHQYRFFGANQTDEQREIVAEIKILHSPARVLCCKMKKEGKGPDILVPVVAINKGLHKAKDKARIEYIGPGLFLTAPAQDSEEQSTSNLKQSLNQ